LTAVAAPERFPDCKYYPLVTGSDAHHPEDIGKRFMLFTAENGSAAEIKKALNNSDGRKADC